METRERLDQTEHDTLGTLEQYAERNPHMTSIIKAATANLIPEPTDTIRRTHNKRWWRHRSA